ncbi:AMP-dependent synthetase, partial [Acinetobacter baumannii]
TEVRIVDDDGVTMAAGMTGEIAIRSPSVMREYYDEPVLTEKTLRDGWLMTGDLGYLDADGFLFHVDRKKDMIIRGGHNIGSLEVEEALFR